MNDRYEVNARGLLAKEILLAVARANGNVLPTSACNDANKFFEELEKRGWMKKVDIDG
jgi:hypothetical protein